MNHMQNLLTQISTMVKKNNEILDASGSRFNMFKVLGVDHYENTHSAIICEFLNTKGSHGLKDLFLMAFINQVLKTDNNFKDFALLFKTESAIAMTEYPTQHGRIDILIEDNKGHAIIIENKIYASDQWEQLKRYNQFALDKYHKGNYRIFYLTLYGTEASENSGEGVSYLPISHSEFIIEWLEECVHLATRYPLVRETLIQYSNHLKKLTNQDMDVRINDEIVDMLSKPENIEAAIVVGRNLAKMKNKLLSEMSKSIANELRLNVIPFPENNNNAIGFTKKEWNKSGVYFASDKGKTYYSIKTNESRNGMAKPVGRIKELFEKNEEKWNPYGYGYVMDDHWETNNQLYLKMADGSLASETIIPYLKKVLDYLAKHPEIEKDL